MLLLAETDNSTSSSMVNGMEIVVLPRFCEFY